MKRLLAVVITFVGCVSANPAAQNVRITSNADVVRQCQFKGNVRAMSGWGSGGIGRHNVEETLKERAHEIGANVVYIVEQASGREMIGSGTGEAYACPEPK